MEVNLSRAFAQRVFVSLYTVHYGEENGIRPLGKAVMAGNFSGKLARKEVSVFLEDGRVKVKGCPVVETDKTPNYTVTVLRVIPKETVLDTLIDVGQMNPEAALEVLCPDELEREEIIDRLRLGLDEVLGFSDQIPVALPISYDDSSDESFI